MNLKIQLAALILISAVATVHAEVRNFRFSGTVDTSFPEGSIGLYLASGPGKTNVLHCAHAPRKIHVKRYDGMNYGWVMVDGSPNGMLLTFVIDRLGAVHGSTSDEE